MKILAMGLGLIVVVIGILAVVAPKEMIAEVEITIDRPIAVVFEDLKMMRNHDGWSPWMKKDPNMSKEFRGTDGTVGFTSSWSGNDKVGVGEQEIKEIIEGNKLVYELRFKKPFESKSIAYMITESVDEQKTRVKWGMNGELPFPGNIICFVMGVRKELMGDLSSGLADLKKRIEG